MSFTNSDRVVSTELQPEPRIVEIQTSGQLVEVVDDSYSDRVRCDHPSGDIDATELADSLIQLADDHGRGRVVALVPAEMGAGMAEQGFELEGTIPGFYRGKDDCAVMGFGVDDERMELANPKEVATTDAVVQKPFVVHTLEDAARTTELAGLKDAEEIARLIDATFVDYPTPSSDPDYIRAQMKTGTPFRVVRHLGEIVACASADLVPDAKTAELTDCATKPSHRGKGHMQRVLSDLVRDLRDMGYPTAFTLARARIPGVNRAFQKLGFRYRGRMPQSCRIGEGFEDMNIWSRAI